MRILYDHQIFSWQLYGGVSRYFFELANSISEIPEHHVEIFSPLYVNEYIKSGRVLPRGVKIPLYPNSGRAIQWVNSVALKLASASRKDIDIFHETYYSGLNCAPASARKIVTVYDMLHEKICDSFSPRERNRTHKIKKAAVARADHVICISENTRRDLIELLNVPEEKTSVVYLGYSLTTPAENVKSIEIDGPYILYVGSRVDYKNFKTLLRVYANSPLLRHVTKLVCFGGGQFSQDELSLMASLNLSSDQILHFAGGDDMLARLYGSATVFVYPSVYEGFGIPPLEAMSFGCPVVCSNSSSLPEVVGSAAELFDPHDEGQIQAAIEGVITFPEKAKELVRRGHERVRQFSWEKCAKDTLSVYESVLRN